MNNINTKEYWDNRFSTGDWENKKGRIQTSLFAREQVNRLGIPFDFEGTILDFGCGLGDAMPIYKKKYPKSKLLGLDHSSDAIRLCNYKYSKIAKFIEGTCDDVPIVDVIISSNVFEHLSNDKEIAEKLLLRCKWLYIIVPFQEPLMMAGENEHINSYNENTFNEFNCHSIKIYKSKGLAQMSYVRILWQVWIKNIARLVVKGHIWNFVCPQEIMFKLKGVIQSLTF